MTSRPAVLHASPFIVLARAISLAVHFPSARGYGGSIEGGYFWASTKSQMNRFHPACQVRLYPTRVTPCIWVLYGFLTHISWLSPSPPQKRQAVKMSFLHNYCVLAMFPSHQSNHISTYDRWINEVELFSTLQDGQSSAITAQSTTSLVLQPGWQTEYSCDMPRWEQNKISKEFIKLISIAKWASSQPSCQWVTKCFLLPLQRFATLSIKVEQPSWPFLSQNRKNLAQQMKTNKVCNKNKCVNQDSNKSVLTSINTEHFISRNAWLWSMHIDALNKHIYKHMVCFGMRKPAKKMNNATPGQGIHTKLKGSRAQMRTWETSNQQKKH